MELRDIAGEALQRNSLHATWSSSKLVSVYGQHREELDGIQE